MTSERTRIVRFVAFMAGSRPSRIQRRTVSGLIPRASAISRTVSSLTLTGRLSSTVAIRASEIVRFLFRFVFPDVSAQDLKLLGLRIISDLLNETVELLAISKTRDSSSLCENF